MTSSTVRYQFEYKILQALSLFSSNCTENLNPYVVVFNSSGHVRRVLYEHQEETWFELVDQLRADRCPHLFFNPCALPEGIWLSWLDVPQSTIERVFSIVIKQSELKIDPKLTPKSDQVRQLKRSVRPDTRQALTEFPSTWEVIFERR